MRRGRPRARLWRCTRVTPRRSTWRCWQRVRSSASRTRCARPVRRTPHDPHAGHAPDPVRCPGRSGARHPCSRVARRRRAPAPATHQAADQHPHRPAHDGRTATWLSQVEAGVMQALQRFGKATGAQLARAEPICRTALLPTSDKRPLRPHAICACRAVSREGRADSTPEVVHRVPDHRDGGGGRSQGLAFCG